MLSGKIHSEEAVSTIQTKITQVLILKLSYVCQDLDNHYTDKCWFVSVVFDFCFMYFYPNILVKN